jgi:uncharacterized protein (DUF58 family)
MRKFTFNDVLSSLRHIRGGIPVQRLSSRVRLGEHRSFFFGPSNDFFDIQEYDPDRDPPNSIIDIGDDETIYARRCIEPHDVQINILVDVSTSISAGVNFHKQRTLLETVGFIGVTGIRYQDPVGLVGFSDRICLNFKSKTGAAHFYYLLKILYNFLVENNNIQKNSIRKTDFFAALDFVRRSFNKRCFIPIVSDFLGFENVVSSPLFRSVAANHELICIFLDDPKEFLSIYGRGYIEMKDIESSRRMIVSRSNTIEIERDERKKRREIRRLLRALGVDSVVLEYGKHFKRLKSFFELRSKIKSSRR